MRQYWYYLPLNPVPWKVGPVQVHRAKPGRLGAHVGRDQEVHAYQQAVKEMLRERGAEMMHGKFSMTVYFWRNMAVYKSRQSERARNQEADGTNLYKAFEDACHEVLFENDKDNVAGQFIVVDQGPKVEGRIIIHITEWKESSTAMMLANLPDVMYGLAYGTGAEQLQIEMSKPNVHLDPGDDEYGSAPVSF